MSKHIHAELMLQYAQDATETDKPWERWEYFSSATNTWRQCVEQTLSWYTDRSYRRKQDVIVVNGHEVPSPVKDKPKMGDRYYFANPCDSDFRGTHRWCDDDADNLLFERRLVHLDEESAIAHAKALLNLGENDG